ncbi:MAG: hypothetical protein ACQ9ET_04400 [Nitrosomonadaceae bacterium]
MVKKAKAILFLALVSLMIAFFLGAISACAPGTAGYDWHSGEMETHDTKNNENL